MITTFEPKRSETALVLKLATYAVADRDTCFRLAVIAAIDVHPQHVLLGGFVVDDLGALDNTIRTEVTGAGAGEKGADEGPFHQVFTAVAVDVLEVCAVCFVFADPGMMGLDFHRAQSEVERVPVISVIDFENATTMRLDVLPGVGLWAI